MTHAIGNCCSSRSEGLKRSWGEQTFVEYVDDGDLTATSGCQGCCVAGRGARVDGDVGGAVAVEGVMRRGCNAHHLFECGWVEYASRVGVGGESTCV